MLTVSAIIRRFILRRKLSKLEEQIRNMQEIKQGAFETQLHLEKIVGRIETELEKIEQQECRRHRPYDNLMDY